MTGRVDKNKFKLQGDHSLFCEINANNKRLKSLQFKTVIINKPSETLVPTPKQQTISGNNWLQVRIKSRLLDYFLYHNDKEQHTFDTNIR